ncbi:hypothetical protein [Micromonospora sp. NBS 11-29]|uniref:hypothetical protein n=1 Tax=Micromonospora sp. NBS 11-29 TaxID=1960879 RepID=UPI0020CDF7F8|nr:hypothetical protein [Micromonospora sp. NBS 11-29]
MSESSTARVTERPVEVVDPLLWDLSAAVADAHQPDEAGACVSASCAGAAWPCAAWDTAQVGLSAARTPRAAASVGGPRRVGDRPAGTATTGAGRLVATAA